MKHILYRILKIFKNIQSKIAFYPTLMAIGGIGLSLVMLNIDQTQSSEYIASHLDKIALANSETARTILSVCASGIISIMVFSFSMVMLMLSQASSNFSPRLLPGLISDRKHQFIIGSYLATTIYCILILLSIHTVSDEGQLPVLSLMIGIILTIFCLCLFLYFIHNISQTIQINNILEKIYRDTVERLEHVVKNEEGIDLKVFEAFPDTANWFHYPSEKSGYFRDLSLGRIKDFCINEKVKVWVLKPKGLYIQKGTELFATERALNEEQIKNINEAFNFSRREFIVDNYVIGFKQISEIAVKAMSPGINDPGTAITSIDYLSEMMSIRLRKRDQSFLISQNQAIARLEEFTFKELFYNVMAEFRTYCKHDPVIVQKLFIMLQFLKSCPASDKNYSRIIKEEAENLYQDVTNVMENKKDLKILRSLSKAV